MSSRTEAVGRALRLFDSGAFRDLLGDLVAIPSTSQDPGHVDHVARYLTDAMTPWLRRMGFVVEIFPNPEAGFGPILVAERLEGPDQPTVLTYGHGDTVRGLDEQWRAGLQPWRLTVEGNHWYGRGTADNKGQHAINLAALEAVISERGGALGFNVKLILEMSEERGSMGLRRFVEAHRERLRADVLIASDGPRVMQDVPTIATGTRGTYHFDLSVSLRPGGVHSGHWGGLTPNPALILSHALASICNRNGRILVKGWLPREIPPAVRAALDGCGVGGGGDSAVIDPSWGEPGLTSAEKIYGWISFIVLAMISGRPENPVNAVAPDARAHCQIRYTVDSEPDQFVPALRRHLDEAGFPEVQIENAQVRMAASRTDPTARWVRFAAASLSRSLDKKTQIIPNTSGALPGDVFVDHLGVPLVWIPHSYNGCKQHGPDEHLLASVAREALAAFAGLWWDIGDMETANV